MGRGLRAEGQLDVGGAERYTAKEGLRETPQTHLLAETRISQQSSVCENCGATPQFFLSFLPIAI